MRKLLLSAVVVLLTSIPVAPAQTRPATAPGVVDREGDLSRELQRLRNMSAELGERKRTLQRRLNDKEFTLAQMRTQLSEKGGISAVALLQHELIQRSDAKLQLERADRLASNRYQALVQLIKNGHTPGEVEEYLEKHPRLIALHAQLDRCDEDLQQLMSQAGANNVMVIRTQAQRDALAKKLDGTETQLRAKAGARLIEEVRQSMEDAARDLKDWSARLDSLKREMVDLDIAMYGYRIAEDAAKSLREDLKRVNDRIDDANSEALSMSGN